MSFFAGTSYLTGVASALFAVFIIFKNPKGPINRVFFVFAMSVALWAIGISNEVTSSQANIAEAWLRIFHIGVCLIPITYCHFSLHVLRVVDSNKILIRMGYLTAFIFITLIPFDFFIAGVQQVIQFPYYLKPGPLYHLFMVYFMVFPGVAEWKLFQASKTLRGNRRLQAKYVFFAGFIGFFGGLTSYLPAYNVKIYPLMNSLVLLYVLIMATSVLKHQLMDIEVIIKRTLVFAGLLLMVMGTVAVVMGITQGYLSRYFVMNQSVSMVLAGFLIIAIYDPTRKYLVNLTDKYLFQKKFDYRKLLKEASKEMAAIKSLKKLSKIVIAFVVRNGRIKSASTFVYSFSDRSYGMQSSRPYIQDIHFHVLREDNVLLQELRNLQGPIERETLNDRLQALGNSKEKARLLECSEILTSLKAEVAIPSFLYHKENNKDTGPELRSILFLGTKKSDEPYNQEDLDVFYTLAQESAIAIENARLYDEAIRKTRENMDLQLQLSQKERKQTLGNMSGSIAHEVKGPIQSIQFATYSIKKIFVKFDALLDGALDPETKRNKVSEITEVISKYLVKINESNDRQLTIATTIERFARMEEDNVDGLDAENIPEDTVEKHKVAVFMAVKLIVEEAKIRYQRRDDYVVEIDTLALPSHLPDIHVNQNMFKQVLLNLLLNAYDALKGREKKKISINAYIDPADQGFIHMEVEDTGSGIPPGTIERIWDNGFSTKPKDRGSGYGLDVCKFIVEKIHRGRIWCTSTVGIGSVFHFKVPIWKEVVSSEKSSVV